MSDGSLMRVYALRLQPGDDLRQSLERHMSKQKMGAGFVVTAVGSLRCAVLRLADQAEPMVLARKFEIVSLVGTLSPSGAHLHISLADEHGATIGGHLLRGCEVYTTVELVVGAAEGLAFSRELDSATGFRELVIRANAPGKEGEK